MIIRSEFSFFRPIQLDPIHTIITEIQTQFGQYRSDQFNPIQVKVQFEHYKN